MPRQTPRTPPSPGRARTRRTWLAAACLGTASLAPAQEAPWTELGRQGMVRVVIVPDAQALERAAYDRQIALLCAGMETCFINFYTNTAGVELALPLPESVAAQTTAVYRRSAKQAGQFLRFSCRLVNDPPNCF